MIPDSCSSSESVDRESLHGFSRRFEHLHNLKSWKRPEQLALLPVSLTGRRHDFWWPLRCLYN